MHDRDGGTTRCPGCGAAVVEREWHRILRCALDGEGRCQHCGTSVPGRVGAFVRQPLSGLRIPPGAGRDVARVDARSEAGPIPKGRP